MSHEQNDDDYGEEGFEELSDEEQEVRGPTSKGALGLHARPAPETDHEYKSSRSTPEEDNQYRDLIEQVKALQRQRQPEDEVRALSHHPRRSAQRGDEESSDDEDGGPHRGARKPARYATEAQVWAGRGNEGDDDEEDDEEGVDEYLQSYIARNSSKATAAAAGGSARSRQPVVRQSQARKVGRAMRSSADDLAQMHAAVSRMPPAGSVMEHAVSGGEQHHLVQHQHLHPSNQHMMMPHQSSNHQAGNNKQGSKGNLTFSFEQLQEMERENERLLGSMIAIHRRRGSSGTFSVNQQYMRGGRQPSSSSINRQKQAREIQRANQMMAMRLESIKPTVRNKNPSKQTWRAKPPARPATLVQPEWQS